MRVAISNLAGVPSIVFGLFGLGFFIQFVGAGIDKVVFGGEKVFGQPALIWAALTLAVLTLPVVIVATEEALRAIPRETREASLALGATKFQTVFKVVVPQALPGHPHRHHPGGQPRRRRGGAHPVHRRGLLPARACPSASPISSWSSATTSTSCRRSRPTSTPPSRILYATVVVLLVLTFVLNAVAVVVRSRMRRRMAAGH